MPKAMSVSGMCPTLLPAFQMSQWSVVPVGCGGIKQVPSWDSLI